MNNDIIRLINRIIATNAELTELNESYNMGQSVVNERCREIIRVIATCERELREVLHDVITSHFESLMNEPE